MKMRAKPVPALWCAACGVAVLAGGKAEHEADGTHDKKVDKLFKRQAVKKAVEEVIPGCAGAWAGGTAFGSQARELW